MNTSFSILYEDDDFLALDKPPGVTVNNSETTRHQQTIQDWAEASIDSLHKKPSEEIPGNDFYNRGGIVHRLDKETSGILLIAKNPESFLGLQSQFKERTIKKKYIALAHGKVSPAIGEIILPVGRLPWNRKQFGIIAGGRPSETKYETIETFEKNGEVFTLLRLFPKTGRTHQIRVHLKYLHHPIVSDFLYAGRKTARRDRIDLPRVFLHASDISLIHPQTGKRIEIHSQLPEDLEKYLTLFTKVS